MKPKQFKGGLVVPSKSKPQARLMAAVAHNPAFAKKVGISQSVGKEFNNADKGKTFNKGGAMKKMVKKMSDGGMPMKDGKPAFIGDGKGKMAKGGMAHSDIAKDKPMMKKVAAKAVKGHEKRLHGMAKGGGVEAKGKTKGKMIKMNKGGRSC
jgi:hypothetical protein